MQREETLIAAALDARTRAYAPYSGYAVGAALLAEDGEIYQGCNIECAAYSVTNCAERTALFTAVANGSTRFAAIAIVGGSQKQGTPDQYCLPCGVCRQALAEFCDPQVMQVISAKSIEDYQSYRLEELLPLYFGAGNLTTEDKR